MAKAPPIIVWRDRPEGPVFVTAPQACAEDDAMSFVTYTTSICRVYSPYSFATYNYNSLSSIYTNLIVHTNLAHMNSIFNRLFRPVTTGTMRFSSESSSLANRPDLPETAQLCTVSAGCFWGVEHLYRKNFPELLDARVGYVGGQTTSPSYRAVCSGRTGHAEALQVAFDPEKTSYRALLEFFYRMHDPTTLNRQGMDAGTQYRSGIFTHSEEQEKIAKRVTELAQKEWYERKEIVTEILPAGKWWDAEEYHQLYLDNNPGGYECPAHFVRKFPPLSE